MQTHAVFTISLSLVLLAGGCQSQTSPGGSTTNNSDMSDARAAQVCLVTARNLDRSGYPDPAIAEYELAREKDPTIKGIARRLAVLYDRQGNDARALQEYKNALRESPFDSEVLNDFGYFYIVRNDGRDAEPHLRLAVAKDPSSERAWINLATALAEQREYSEAYGAFTRVLSPAQAWSNLGMIQSQQGDYKTAVQSLTKAAEADPNLRSTKVALEWARKKAASSNPAP